MEVVSEEEPIFEEQIVTIGRESRAQGVAETARKQGISEQTFTFGQALWRHG